MSCLAVPGPDLMMQSDVCFRPNNHPYLGEHAAFSSGSIAIYDARTSDPDHSAIFGNSTLQLRQHLSRPGM
jgi:hypothetical protein